MPAPQSPGCVLTEGRIEEGAPSNAGCRNCYRTHIKYSLSRNQTVANRRHFDIIAVIMTQRHIGARERIRVAAGQAGLLRARDVRALGLHREYLRRMCHDGLLTRIDRGIYALPNDDVAATHTLARISVRAPGAVVCLLSALAFHGVTTQVSDRVWIAIAHKARRPALSYPPIELVRMSGATLSYGAEQHVIQGTTIRVFSPAKTVADCFKYRSRVGLAVAIEALREIWRHGLATTDELFDAARVCRVTRVMRPYIEATV